MADAAERSLGQMVDPRGRAQGQMQARAHTDVHYAALGSAECDWNPVASVQSKLWSPRIIGVDANGGSACNLQMMSRCEVLEHRMP